MSISDTQQDDAAIIRGLMHEWCEALRVRDMDRLLATYDSDILLFDIGPLPQIRGAEGYRKNWENTFPFLPEAISFEIAELKVHTSGDVAFAHCFNRMINAATGADATCGWVRVSVGFERQDGSWKAVHEHVSLPINPMTGGMEKISLS